MEEVEHTNGGSTWPAAVNEVFENLQWKNDLPICNRRSTLPAAMEDVLD